MDPAYSSKSPCSPLPHDFETLNAEPQAVPDPTPRYNFKLDGGGLGNFRVPGLRVRESNVSASYCQRIASERLG